MGYTKAATRFQVIDNPYSYQGRRRLLGIPGHQRLPAVKWSSTFLCLYQVMGDSLFIPGEVSYSHQWPWCGERFLGLNTPEERFLGSLRVWRLGERDPRLWDDSG